MSASITGEDREVVIADAVENLTSPYYVLDPSAATLSVLPETEIAESPAESIIAAESSALKQIRDDFKQAISVGELVDGGLTLVEQSASPEASVIGGDDGHYVIVATPEEVTAVYETAQTEALQAFATEQADSQPTFPMRKPGRQQIRETASDRLGDGFVTEFDAALAGVESFTETTEVDGVTLALVLAARNEQLLYDVSKWGEDIGLASKATFSRTKTNLEDNGLVDTEKVPIDVGRPRLRLLPGNEEVANTDATELIPYLQELLND